MSKQKPHKHFTIKNYWVWIILAVILFFGLAARFFDFDDPPLDFHPTRQLHSMVIARGMYYEKLDGATPEKRALAIQQWKGEGQIEPPVMERLSSWGYQLVGRDDLRIPRLLSIFFWTMGGIGLFFMSRDLAGAKGAIVGLTYFMLLPFALSASRSFQPEPLMTAAIIFSWWSIIRWYKQKSWANAIIAGLLAGFAIYVKLPAIFFVAPPYAVLLFANQNFKDVIKNPQVYTIVALSALPGLIYQINGLYIAGFLKSQMSFRVFPDLLKSSSHYLRWMNIINSTLKVEFFLLGVFGSLLIKDKTYRVMLLSIFLGYFLYGTVFAYHIESHNYYQLPIIPAVAVGLAICVAVLVENLEGKEIFKWLVVIGLSLFWIALNFGNIWRNSIYSKSDLKTEPDFYVSLGEKLKGFTVISITPDYGYRLAYWGWKPSVNWMSTADFNMRELTGMEIDRRSFFLDALKGQNLFLITDFAEFGRQPEVREFLFENFSVFEEGEGFIIFDLRGNQ